MLKSYAAQVKKELLIQSALIALDALLCAAFYALIANAVGNYLFSFDYVKLCYLLSIALAVVAARFIIKTLLCALKSKLHYRIEEAVRRDLIVRIFNENPLSVQLKSSLNTSVINAVSDIVPYFTGYLLSLRAAIIIPAILWGAILSVSPVSAGILLIITPLIPLFMIFIGKGTQKLNDRQWAQISRLNQRFQEAVSQINVLKLFNLEKKEVKNIKFMTRRWRLETLNILKVAFLSALALEFFCTVGIAFCAITLGFSVYEKGFDYRYALFVLLCAPEYFLPLRNLGQSYHIKINALAAAKQLAYWFDDNNSLEKNSNKPLLLNVTQAPFSFSINKVTLVYPDGRVGVNNLNLKIKAGKTTALIGASGSGKSSVLRALCGFLKPQDGSIFINDVSYDTFDTKDLVNHIAYIPQQPKLFYGTLFDNFSMGRSDITHERVIDVLVKLNIKDFINNFPGGFCYILGDDGKRVSGGQARIISLIRALLTDKDIFLFDEPTSSLDEELEIKVLDGFFNNFPNKTVVIAAHRTNLIKYADEVIAIDGR